MLRLVARSFAFGLVGLVGVPVLAFALLLAVIAFDTTCNSPGDSGGCYMGLVSLTLAAAPFGFAAFFLITLARGLWRRAKAARPPAA